MPPRSLLQTNFNGGEQSQRMEGRPDLASYATGVRLMQNMIPTVQGPAVKRSGTRFVAAAHVTTGRCELIPFEYNITQGYVIEATANMFRFFTNDVLLLDGGGSPHEVVTPWGDADLAAIDWAQSLDVLYLVAPGHPPQKLSRTSATSFALDPLALKNGPFADQNIDEALTVTPSAATGTITLSASDDLFLPGHAGALMEIEAKDFRTIPAWEPNVKVAIGMKRRSDGKVYEATALPASGGERTGNERPVHDEGEEWDGSSTGKDYNDKDVGGVRWKYLYGRAGHVRILAVYSPTSADAEVVTRLPDEVAGTPTDLWAHAAFSEAAGWPEVVAIRDERLWLARGPWLYASVAGDYENFAARDTSGIAQPDLGIKSRLPDPQPIRWLANDRTLLIGTARSEYAVQPVNPAQAIGFANVKLPRQSAHGSEKVRPVPAGSATLFVSRAGRKLRAADWQYDRDKYVSPDVTVRAEHISGAGICRLAAQPEPEAGIWALRRDGLPVNLTWSEDESVRGFSRHPLGGEEVKVESLTVIPSPDGGYDQLWLAVSRTVAGRRRRSIERLLPLWRHGQDQKDGCFVDCSLTYEGQPATIISGLQHLANATVTVIADGATHPDCVVSGNGSITLNHAASVVHAGLFYEAAIETMRITTEIETGAALSKLKRVVKLGLGLLDTTGIRFGRAGGRMEAVPFRTSADAMDHAVPLFSGEMILGFPGGHDREARIRIESSQPLPFTLTSLSPRLDVGGLD